MVTKTISIRVSDRAASAYEKASMKRHASSTSSQPPPNREATAPSAHRRRLWACLARKATERGLTEEKLDEILNAEV